MKIRLAADLQTDVGISNIKDFAIEIMNAYAAEIKDINNAACKVRGVV